MISSTPGCRSAIYFWFSHSSHGRLSRLIGTLTRWHLHPAQWLHKLPDNVSFEEGSLCEPLAVALAGIERSGLRLGDPLLIWFVSLFELDRDVIDDFSVVRVPSVSLPSYLRAQPAPNPSSSRTSSKTASTSPSSSCPVSAPCSSRAARARRKWPNKLKLQLRVPLMLLSSALVLRAVFTLPFT